MTVNIEIAGQAKKIENSDNLSEKPLWGNYLRKIFYQVSRIYSFRENDENQNSGIYLINYAKIRVKMTYFIASVPVGKIQTYKTEIFFV